MGCIYTSVFCLGDFDPRINIDIIQNDYFKHNQGGKL
jgi:hypothetical protein